MSGPADANVETMLLKVLIQLIVIISASRLAGVAFRKLGQPQVCGEVAAGLILGPSLLGKLAPEFFSSVFSTATGPVLNVLSQLGLILLMFLVGLEFDFAHLKTYGKTAAATSIAGIALPFGLGILVAQLVHPWVAPETNKIGFALLLATALAITAIPVLSRIMMELNLQRTSIGTITITAAAVDDVAGWTILTIATAVVRSEFRVTHAVATIAEAAVFCAVMLFAVRPVLRKWIQHTRREDGTEPSLTTIAVLIVLVLGAAAITNLIGIFSIFGAFLTGTLLHDEREFAEAITLRLRDFTTTFFLPIFFTYTGLRTDIGSMTGALLWAVAGLIIAAAIVGKLVGCGLAARFVGSLSWRDSLTIGILMNTRGLMELIVINLGYELHVFPRSVFFMLVLMTLVTTYMTTPLVRRAIRNTELEQLVQESSFVLGHRKAVRVQQRQ
jgi:Kef-type K+ transport system membrane component KefB